ncbi:MAG: hypothetical protein VB084_15905 [Syntrophomonadaceae bacterium]|nr:hypothetical protein [Syntrophomonadaceae bacterium]
MDIYLTDEEMEREKALFAPHQESYPALEGKRIYEIKEFEPIDTGDSDRPKPPPSC